MAETEDDGASPRARRRLAELLRRMDEHGLALAAAQAVRGDYFGVDVNVAARVAAAANPDEVLISDAVHDRLEDGQVRARRRWLFQGKGAPAQTKVFSVEPAP